MVDNPKIKEILEPHQGSWQVWAWRETRKLKRYEKGDYYNIQSSNTEVQDTPKEKSELETQIEILKREHCDETLLWL